jgi:hypothetical protein
MKPVSKFQSEPWSNSLVIAILSLIKYVSAQKTKVGSGRRTSISGFPCYASSKLFEVIWQNSPKPGIIFEREYIILHSLRIYKLFVRTIAYNSWFKIYLRRRRDSVADAEHCDLFWRELLVEISTHASNLRTVDSKLFDGIIPNLRYYWSENV